MPGVLTAHRDLWIALDPAARARLGQLPFVILDAEFRNEAWWRVDVDLDRRRVDARQASEILPRDVNETLVQELMLFAWQMTGTDRKVARMCFGMTSAVAEQISSLTSQQIRAITLRPDARAQLRWSQDLNLWRDLLTAAASDAAMLGELQLTAKLRFCSEIIEGSERGAGG